MFFLGQIQKKEIWVLENPMYGIYFSLITGQKYLSHKLFVLVGSEWHKKLQIHGFVVNGMVMANVNEITIG